MISGICTLCHRMSGDLMHCSHHSPRRHLRHNVCTDCRHAIHLAGVLAGDKETIKYMNRMGGQRG